MKRTAWLLIAVALLCAPARDVRAANPLAFLEPPPRPALDLYEEVAGKYEPVLLPVRSGDKLVGEVDWTRGVVYAVGTAKVRGKSPREAIMAHRAARMIAARNAILLVHAIQAGPDDEIGVRDGRVEVRGRVRGFEEADSHYDRERRTVTVKLQAPLYGVDGVVKVDGLKVPRPKKRWDGWGAPATDDEADLLIVDARGARPDATLAPCLTTGDGRTVLWADDPHALRKRGQARYVRVEADETPPATTRPVDERDAPRPLVLRATPGDPPGTLVLDEASLDRLSRHPEARSLWDRGQVVILVRPTAETSTDADDATSPQKHDSPAAI